METIKGEIDKIIFHNRENCYSVISCLGKFNDDNKVKEFTAIGTIPSPKVGMNFQAKGEWVVNKRFGPQFSVSDFTEVFPTSYEGIVNYLSSGMIKGIGLTTAKKIVNAFKDDTFEVLEKEPERLREIKGMPKKKLGEIIEQIKAQKTVRDIMVFLKTYEVSDNLIGKIYGKYGSDTIPILSENPYVMADDIDGISFKRADDIAIKMGIDHKSDKRIGMGIKYVLNAGANDKDTYLPREELLKRACDNDILALPESDVNPVITKMINDGALEDDNGNIYLRYWYEVERRVARMISAKCVNDMFDNMSWDETVLDDGVEYSEEQISAIKKVASSKMVVITGGPGTGKTTILKGIINLCKKNFLQVRLAAPTGRAAKRMSESTGTDAMTIHRLLEWRMGAFTINENNQLKGDILILDETSMINIKLMDAIMRAVPPRMKVVMVGDVDQLPPIGCGNVLKDVINSGVVPVTRLTKIYRQDAQSKIILNAHAINEGRLPDISNPPGTDFYFFSVQGIDNVRNQVIRLMTDAIPNKFGISTDDIQVLTPMRKETDMIGSIQLNNALQEILNPDGKVIKNKTYSFRIGDRVMHNKNNYDLGVFNGDIGKIIDIDFEDKVVTVDYPGYDEPVRYNTSVINELELAYATTVHKSQGSEYKAVVIVADRSQYIMLQKQLFYTAVTRAKNLCCVVGSREAVIIMTTTKPKDTRHSMLDKRIVESYQNLMENKREKENLDAEFKVAFKK